METSRELDQEKPLERRQIPPALPVLMPTDIHTVTGASNKTPNVQGPPSNTELEDAVSIPQLDLSEVDKESTSDALADNRPDKNAINTKPEDTINSPTLPSNNDTKEVTSEEPQIEENPTLEETSEETPAKENPTSIPQVANAEDEDGLNDSIEDAANFATSPEDLAKDKGSEESNLDDSSIQSEELTKSQVKSRRKRAQKLEKMEKEEGDRLLMEVAIKTPLKDKDESEENHQPDQDHPEVPVRLAPLFIATPAKATKASTRISKIARKKSSPKNK